MDNNRLQIGSIAKKITSSNSFSILMIAIVMCVALAIINPTFISVANIQSVTRAFSYIAIMAIGELMVILTAGIDLSIGSMIGLGGLLSAYLIVNLKLPIFFAVILAVLACSVFGFISGVLVTRVKLPPFIATLGIMSIARSICYIVTKGYPILRLPNGFLYIGQGFIARVPVPVWLMLIVGIGAAVFLNKTITGRRIFALGGNEEATRFSGINTNRIKLLVYVLSASLSGFAGVILTSRMGSAQSSVGISYELDGIAAVIIGGTSFSGGEGTVLGTIIGAAIMGIIKNALVLLQVDPYWQQLIIGFIIILAVSIDQMRRMNIENSIKRADKSA
jgi:ribose transport system permease protein